jgi:hypothetical protein
MAVVSCEKKSLRNQMGAIPMALRPKRHLLFTDKNNADESVGGKRTHNPIRNCLSD